MQLFLHVVETGSITAGAERTHMALASASARLKGMEELLGMPLLLRGRRGVIPTPVGRSLVHHARVRSYRHRAGHGNSLPAPAPALAPCFATESATMPTSARPSATALAMS